MAVEKFIVKPIYFRATHDGPTEIRLFMVYDPQLPAYETHPNGNHILVPNFLLRAASWDALGKWFETRDMTNGQWRLTPPSFAHIDEFHAYAITDIIDI